MGDAIDRPTGLFFLVDHIDGDRDGRNGTELGISPINSIAIAL